MASIDPLVAVGVVLATAATDAVYVMFNSAVASRRRPAGPLPGAAYGTCYPPSR